MRADPLDLLLFCLLLFRSADLDLFLDITVLSAYAYIGLERCPHEF